MVSRLVSARFHLSPSVEACEEAPLLKNGTHAVTKSNAMHDRTHVFHCYYYNHRCSRPLSKQRQQQTCDMSQLERSNFRIFFLKLFSSGKTCARSCFAVSVGGTWEVQRCKIQTSMTADACCVFKIWLRPSIGGLRRVDLKRRLFMRRVQKLVHEPRWSTSRFKFDAQIYTSQTQSSDQMNAFPEFTLTWRQFGAKGFGLTTSSLAK